MNLVKSTGTFGFYTIISRLLGYLRDVLIAIFLGTSFLADAFFVAFRIPNTFRRLFAEGTFNSAFVPSYTSELVKNKSKSNKFANDVFNLFSWSSRVSRRVARSTFAAETLTCNDCVDTAIFFKSIIISTSIIWIEDSLFWATPSAMASIGGVSVSHRVTESLSE